MSERRGHLSDRDEVTVGGPGSCNLHAGGRGVPHAGRAPAWKPGALLFLYTRPRQGGLIEEQHRTAGRKFGSMNERELADILQHNSATLGAARTVAALSPSWTAVGWCQWTLTIVTAKLEDLEEAARVVFKTSGPAAACRHVS